MGASIHVLDDTRFNNSHGSRVSWNPRSRGSGYSEPRCAIDFARLIARMYRNAR